MASILYTVDEVASAYRVHVNTVRYWIRKGAVEVIRTPGGAVRIVDAQVARIQHCPAQSVTSLNATP